MGFPVLQLTGRHLEARGALDFSHLGLFEFLPSLFVFEGPITFFESVAHKGRDVIEIADSADVSVLVLTTRIA